MVYQLRTYQEDLISQVFKSWNQGNRKIMLQLPTGAGKTVIFAAIIDEFLKQGKRAMVVAHRKELIRQAYEKIKTVTNLKAGVIQSGFEQNLNSPIQVASIQTLIRRENILDLDLLIFDEAHHTVGNSYKKIIDRYPTAYILGVTATPARMDGQGFNNLYNELIIGASVGELIEQGYLSRFRIFAAVSKIKTQGIKITGGDFNLKELSQAVAAADITGDLVPTWQKYAEGKKTVLFAVNIAHSKECAKAFNNAGIIAEHIDGTTPAHERDSILERFRNGKTLVLCNCNIVTEGFDVPSIEAIQCVRPTLSFILYMQMFGRALRPATSKEYAVLIDHTNNWAIHGLPNHYYEWSLEPKFLTQDIFTQKCPQCGHIFQPLPHEISKILGNSLYRDQLLTIHLATCPYCQTKSKFFLGIGKNSKVRQLTLDLLEEYGEIIEIPYELLPDNYSANDLLNILTSNAEDMFKKYGGLTSVNSINVSNILNIPAKVYIYGNRVENHYLNEARTIEGCYTGTAILEINLEKKYKLAIAEVTTKSIIPNPNALVLFKMIEIDISKQKTILDRIGKTFCFQIKLKYQEKKAKQATENRKKALEQRQAALKVVNRKKPK